MELLGPSLAELCQRIAPYTYLSGPTVMRVGRGALSLLHQLHVAGYVHNDVKPGNLLLGRGASASAIHLIDFGLATLATDMVRVRIRVRARVRVSGRAPRQGRAWA